MEYILKNLKPYKVFKYFEEITRIPRGSGNEKGISDYFVSFAKSHNLEVKQDSVLNVIIKKPASKGYEHAKTVILQGHMDMVCEKAPGIIHDFEKDPIKLKIKDDMIYADGTTLGGDDGIAGAMALAILDSDEIAHPPLEVVLTTSEETGMDGAIGLDPKDIDGRTIINLDSEEEGNLCVSCAGGIRDLIELPVTFEKVPQNTKGYAIKVSGLQGGHSGEQIYLQRGNANKIMGRFLSSLYNDVKFNISYIEGGVKSNAIPREAEAVIFAGPEYKEKIESDLKYWNGILKNEFNISDPDINLTINKTDKNFEKVLSKKSSEKVIELLCAIPNGVHTMSLEIKGLVQSSTNLGVVKTEKDKVTFLSEPRSSVQSLKDEIVNTTKIIAENIGAKFSTYADYPAWQYKKDSKLRELFINVYKKLYKKAPKITAIHAGLECGLFEGKFGKGELDIVSFGPDILDIHTTNEHLSISSVQRTWEYLLEVLKEIK